MARSPLTGIDRAAQEAPGRDEAALGPSDSSDSGSDMAGLLDRDGEGHDGSDPGLPIDVALRDEQSARADRPMEPHPEATDIGVDRIFVPGGSADAAADAELDAALDGATANDPFEDEDEAGSDGDDDPAPDENEREISAATAGVPASAAPVPGPPADPPLPNPSPDAPVEDPDAPNDEGDAEIRKPGRDPAAVQPPPGAESSPPPKRRRFVPPRRW